MTNQPEAEVDDLGLTAEDWLDLQAAYTHGTLEPEPGTVEDEAFRRLDACNRAEATRAAEAGEADRAWAAAHAAAPEPEPEPEAG